MLVAVVATVASFWGYLVAFRDVVQSSRSGDHGVSPVTVLVTGGHRGGRWRRGPPPGG